MSEKRKKRGRGRHARITPTVSFENELKLRNNSSRVIKKPKYLTDPDEDEISSEKTSPPLTQENVEDKVPLNGNKPKNSRGYNPEVGDKLKNSDYHYGSDFEMEESDKDKRGNGNSSTSATSSSSDSESSDDVPLPNTAENNLWWKLGPAGNIGIQAHSPTPVWLQDRKFPKLDLPKSSDDLLIPSPMIMQAISIYEVLRHFRPIVRIATFHFEDFCAALLLEEPSVLLAEIHLALLKALIREEDAQQTHFGSLDQKDSVNIILYLADSVTWPATLQLYLQSDHEFKPYLKILESCSYPDATPKERLKILQFLCDQFLQTTVVRESLITEGKIRFDDHCRICHKVGDLLCCDSCSAAYHLDCTDPPVDKSKIDLPGWSWTCPVCTAQELEGVSDCLSPMEMSDIPCRQEPLGFDRHGRKYWFLVRRVVVETEDGEMKYYSTPDHLSLLLSLFDSADLEEGLFMAFKEFGEDIRRQMTITEELTERAGGTKMAWLSEEKENLPKEKESLMEKKLANERDAAVDNVIEEVKTEVMDIKQEPLVGVDVKDEPMMDIDIKSELMNEDKIDSKMPLKDVKEETEDETFLNALIEEKKRQLSGSSKFFRFGCDYNPQSYTNLYHNNILALNKMQQNEERDKKRHFSHKFSLNDHAEFKWKGVTNGSPDNLANTVRQTLVSLEQNMSTHFFHPNWPNLRKAWNQSALLSSDASHLSKAIRLIVACIKPVVFNNVWNESLGHVRLKRITALEREEKKKQEKKEKKESEEESRYYPFIKFTKGVKHQLWKVRGEEYRIHGMYGWLWLSSVRKISSVPMSSVGLRAGADKITVPIKTQTGIIRGLPISPTAYKQFALKNKCLEFSLLSPQQRREEEEEEEVTQAEENEAERSELLIANAGTQQKVVVVGVPLEEHFENGLVNVSKALNSRLRLVYPKIPKPSTLDNLLTRRLSLKLQEERELIVKNSDKDDEDKDVDIETGDSDNPLSDDSESGNIDELPDSQRSIVHSQRLAGNLLKEINTHKQKYETLDKQNASHSCYSPSCREKGRGSCYSTFCTFMEKTKSKLISSVNNYKIVTSKPSPYDQVGTHCPVRLNDDALSTKAAPTRESTPKRTNSNNSKSKTNDESNHESRKLEEKTERIYSTEKPSGKIYLKKYNAEVKRTKKPTNKIPHMSTFKMKGKGNNRYSMLILSPWELKILARRGGKYNPLYFNPNAKLNQQVWPYPCSRPFFKTTWLYRTTILNTISAAALQLRILWACLRWEDMQEKGPGDGRKQVTTDVEIVQTEILKRKYSGRFNEKTEYLQRKVVIPFEVPKPVREFTPSQRSGLRKRRRAQSPISQLPQSFEEWIDEEKLYLWEIKYFGERIEKVALINRKAIVTSEKNNGDATSFQAFGRSTSPAEFKAKIEEQLKIQRANFNIKKALEVQNITTSKGIVKVAVGSGSKLTIGGGSPLTIKGSTTVVSSSSQLPSIVTGRKIVTTKGGKILTLQTAGNSGIQNEVNPTKISLGNSSVFPVSSLPKVQVTPQGNKVIRFHTLTGRQQRAILPRLGTPGGTNILSTALSPTSTPPAVSLNQGSATSTPIIRPASGQQIHIIRLPDGQIQVNQLKSPQKENPIRNVTPLSAGQIVKINGQQVLLKTSGTDGKPLIGVNTQSNAKTAVVTNTSNPTSFKAIRTQDGIVIKSPLTVSNNQTASFIKSKVTTEPTVVKSNTSVAPTSTTTSMTSTTANPPQSGTGASSLTLRVQVRMTEQGPKTIIQGLEPGVGLTKDHIMAIQQQVRSMLAQYNLQVNQLSPLMTLTLQMTSKNQDAMLPQKASAEQRNVTTPTGVEKGIKKLNVLEAFKVTNNNEQDTKVGQKSMKKFVVTNEYIQQTVKSALNRSDLSPDVEEKLVQLHKYTSDKGKDPADSLNEIPSGNKGAKRTREQEDDWDELPNKTKSKKNKVDRTPKATKKEAASNNNNNNTQSARISTQDSKKKLAKQQKLEGLLAKHKDLLKKDILKKRALLEKELQLQIHKELTAAKQQISASDKSKQIDSPSSAKKKLGTETTLSVSASSPSVEPPSYRQQTPKKTESPTTIPNFNYGQSKIAKNLPKSKRTSKGKNKKIVCICRTPFDDSKFYVGCDMCGNWFHGDCVGITESLSRTMTEYVCDDCANAKLNKELFCTCKQPYDESQFYIFCEKCEGWYHGKCIGILQQEAEEIDEYICPECDSDTVWNRPCQKKLSNKDYIELKKVAKSLIQHKNAWPFLEPVDQSEVPDYYKVVKDPMDLKSMESKVLSHKYKTISEFCGDVMLVFDNCRAYNPPNSSFWSCANTMEGFFCVKLKQLKLKVTQKT